MDSGKLYGLKLNIKYLISWCKKENKNLRDISIFVYNTNKRNPLYSLICKLRRYQDILDKESIDELNKYYMPWGKEKIDYNSQVHNVLIPWCQDNQMTIEDIFDNTNNIVIPNDILRLVKNLIKVRDKLTSETINLLDKHEMVWDQKIVSLSRKKLDLLEKKIKEELIDWCNFNHKKLYQIPTMINGKHNPKYIFIDRLRKFKSVLPTEIINLLNEYGMPWSGTKRQHHHNRLISSYENKAKNVLIKHCEQNNITIDQIDGSKKLLYLIKLLRKNKEHLSKNTIRLLDNHNMIWQEEYEYLKTHCCNVLEERIENELIPYLNSHNLTIPEVRSYDESGKVSKYYKIITLARRSKNHLKQKYIDLLNRYGMIWEIKAKQYNPATEALRTSPENRIIKELIPHCVQHNCKIYEIPTKINGKINPLYSFVNHLKIIKDDLPRDIIKLLDDHGMIWHGRSPKLIQKTKDRLKNENSHNHNIIIKRIKNELIPWCEQNNKMIYEVPSSLYFRQNPLYTLITNIKKIKEELSDEIIILLNKYGMPWRGKLIEKAYQRHTKTQTIVTNKNDETQSKQTLITEHIKSNTNNITNSTCIDKPSSILPVEEKVDAQNTSTTLKKSNTIAKSEGTIVEPINYKNSNKKLKSNRYVSTLDNETDKKIKIKLTSCVDKVMKWLDKRLKYFDDITPESDCYEEYLFILNNVNLLADQQLEDLELYGFQPNKNL